MILNISSSCLCLQSAKITSIDDRILLFGSGIHSRHSRTPGNCTSFLALYFFPLLGMEPRTFHSNLRQITCQDSLGKKHHCHSHFLDGKPGWVGKEGPKMWLAIQGTPESRHSLGQGLELVEASLSLLEDSINIHGLFTFFWTPWLQFPYIIQMAKKYHYLTPPQQTGKGSLRRDCGGRLLEHASSKLAFLKLIKIQTWNPKKPHMDSQRDLSCQADVTPWAPLNSLSLAKGTMTKTVNGSRVDRVSAPRRRDQGEDQSQCRCHGSGSPGREGLAHSTELNFKILDRRVLVRKGKSIRVKS